MQTTDVAPGRNRRSSARRSAGHAGLALALALSSPAIAAQQADPPGAEPGVLRWESAELGLRVRPRSPDQVAAFYEARKFPAEMVALLREQCFVTIGIRNKSREVIWHDAAGWRISVEGRPVQRRSREWLANRWEQMGVPWSARSTFRWTLLPESLDFRPEEAEGGNIVLPSQTGAMRLEARFVVGSPDSGRPIEVVIDGLRCAGSSS